ncbi:hypothetical protein EV30_14900, partial [Staphylococcus aureus]
LEPWDVQRPVPTARDQLRELFKRNFVFIGCLFPRRAYEEVGGSDESLRKVEDWDLWLRMVGAGTPVTAVKHPTVIYRMSDNSLT